MHMSSWFDRCLTHYKENFARLLAACTEQHSADERKLLAEHCYDTEACTQTAVVAFDTPNDH